MEKLILEYIKNSNLIEKENEKILVAVSGGPDSICLLNVLFNLKENLKISLYVAHVNHLIREEAKADSEFVKEFCEERKIPFFYKEINVLEKAKKEKLSVEEAGRNARYEFFEEIIKENKIDKLAIGHNKNDLAETIIMNLLRGSGTRGLKGIKAKNGKYIRPLLNTTRDSIEEYCSENNLNPRIDLTNFDNNYTRNKIRNNLIPYIKNEFNPNIIETLARLSSIVIEEQQFIDNYVEKSYKNILEKKEKNVVVINVKKFSSLEEAIKRRVIFYIVFVLFGTSNRIEKKHVEDIVRMIDKNVGNKFLMPNKNLKVSINRGYVSFIKL